jgi:hypothetical protein
MKEMVYLLAFLILQRILNNDAISVGSNTILVSTFHDKSLVLMSVTGCHVFSNDSKEVESLRDDMKGSLVVIEEAGFKNILDICELLRSMSNMFIGQGERKSQVVKRVNRKR